MTVENGKSSDPNSHYFPFPAQKRAEPLAILAVVLLLLVNSLLIVVG